MVSVIIPVFNGSSFLEETVYSVNNSTYKNIEIILVDDGSKDTSKAICHNLEKKYKNVHFYSFEQNKGLGRTLNFALQKAKGEYICRINQDDLMLRHRIETQVDFLNKNRRVVAVGSYIMLFNETNKTSIVKFLATNKQIKNVWLLVSPFSDPSVMYRKKTALKVGAYDQTFWPADDVHLWYRMGKAGQFANIPKVLVHVRWHDKAGSIRFMKINAIKTYRLHRWAHNHVEKAPIKIQLFWIGQLLAGLLLPARLNWAVYRVMKKIISVYFPVSGFLKTKIFAKNKKARRVNPHPKKLSFSGS